MRIPKSLVEGLQATAAFAFFGGAIAGPLTAGYFRGIELEDQKAEVDARIREQTRTNVLGTIRSTNFVPSSNTPFLGPGIGFSLDSSGGLGFGPSLFAFNPDYTVSQLSFVMECNIGMVRVWRIRVETSRRSNEVLANLANTLQPGKTVRIASGIESEPGQLYVEPEDIEVEN